MSWLVDIDCALGAVKIVYMNIQTSQDYTVDGRYSFGEGAADNNAGLSFLRKYLDKDKRLQQPNITEQRKEDDRFIVSGPGDNKYTFKNAFRAAPFNRSQPQD